MLSIPHMIVIFVVALVVFGPEKLPELARNLGKVMAEFRRHTTDLRSSFEGHLRDLEREADARRIGGSLPATTSQPPAAQQTMAQPAIPAPAPGTVPSNSPNATAVTGSRPEPAPSDASAAPARKHPGDDPFLADLTAGEFGPGQGADPGQPSAPPEPEKIPGRVTDGDPHHA